MAWEGLLLWLVALALLALFVRVATQKNFFRGGNTAAQTVMMEYMNEDKRKSVELVQYEREVAVHEADQGESPE